MYCWAVPVTIFYTAEMGPIYPSMRDLYIACIWQPLIVSQTRQVCMGGLIRCKPVHCHKAESQLDL